MEWFVIQIQGWLHPPRLCTSKCVFRQNMNACFFCLFKHYFIFAIFFRDVCILLTMTCSMLTFRLKTAKRMMKLKCANYLHNKRQKWNFSLLTKQPLRQYFPKTNSFCIDFVIELEFLYARMEKLHFFYGINTNLVNLLLCVRFRVFYTSKTAVSFSLSLLFYFGRFALSK